MILNLNDNILHKNSIKTAVILAHFQDYICQMFSDGLGGEDGFFPVPISETRKATGLSSQSQRSEIRRLKGEGLIEVVYKGLPPVRHIRLNDDSYPIPDEACQIITPSFERAMVDTADHIIDVLVRRHSPAEALSILSALRSIIKNKQATDSCERVISMQVDYPDGIVAKGLGDDEREM